MSFAKDGFLSAEMPNWISANRAANADWFKLVERLRHISQAWLMEIIPADNRTSVTMLLIFARAVTSFQAIELLAERGLSADARTIARSFLETVVYYGSAKANPEFVERLIAADRKHKENVAKPLVKMGQERSGLDAAAIARLEAWLANPDAPKPEALQIEPLMKTLGLGEIYDTYFRGLSGDAAHTTITSLNRHASIDDAGALSGTKFGPDFSDTGDTLMTMCSIMFYLLHWVRETYPDLSNSAEDDSCWAEYKRLVDSRNA